MSTYRTYDGEIIDERRVIKIARPEDGIPAYYVNGYIRSYVQQWRSRLFLEWYGMKYKSHCLFVTLTYDNAKCGGAAPTTPIKEHIQKFMKRLRSYYDFGYTYVGTPRRKVLLRTDGIKYFFVHEQGDKYNRLHYHGVIYGIGHNWNEYLVLEKAWKFGHVRSSVLTARRINYCLKYLHKNYAKSMRRVISNGIGDSFLTTDRKIDIRNRFIAHGVLNVHINGWSYPIPRYYKEKIWCAVDWTYSPGMFTLKKDKCTGLYVPIPCKKEEFLSLPAFGIFMKREYKKKREQILDEMKKRKEEQPSPDSGFYKVVYPDLEIDDCFVVTNLTVDERRRIEKINKTVLELNEIYNG